MTRYTPLALPVALVLALAACDNRGGDITGNVMDDSQTFGTQPSDPDTGAASVPGSGTSALP